MISLRNFMKIFCVSWMLIGLSTRLFNYNLKIVANVFLCFFISGPRFLYFIRKIKTKLLF